MYKDVVIEAGLPHLVRVCPGPALRGQLRATAADFAVTEKLGYELSGEGEHLWLWVEKSGCNTDWLAGQLARAAGVARKEVGFAGLKDRHAVTRQWFSLPVKEEKAAALSELAMDREDASFRVLAVKRHRRKLKRGGLAGNDFRIVIRAVEGDVAAAEACLRRLRDQGCPNYFGEQRFGRGGANLQASRGRVSRQQLSMELSAARSWLFNQVLSRRVADDSWLTPQAGDVMMLAGSHSVFAVAEVDETLRARHEKRDVHVTGPLWGEGELMSDGGVAMLEREMAAEHADLAARVERARMNQERRALRMLVGDLRWSFAADSLVLEFSLPAGSFATSLLREVVDYRA